MSTLHFCFSEHHYLNSASQLSLTVGSSSHVDESSDISYIAHLLPSVTPMQKCTPTPSLRVLTLLSIYYLLLSKLKVNVTDSDTTVNPN